MERMYLFTTYTSNDARYISVPESKAKETGDKLLKQGFYFIDSDKRHTATKQYKKYFTVQQT